MASCANRASIWAASTVAASANRCSKRTAGRQIQEVIFRIAQLPFAVRSPLPTLLDGRQFLGRCTARLPGTAPTGRRIHGVDLAGGVLAAFLLAVPLLRQRLMTRLGLLRLLQPRRQFQDDLLRRQTPRIEFDVTADLTDALFKRLRVRVDALDALAKLGGVLELCQQAVHGRDHLLDLGGAGLRLQVQDGNGGGPFVAPRGQLSAAGAQFLLGGRPLLLQPFRLPGRVLALLALRVEPLCGAFAAIQHVGQRLVRRGSRLADLLQFPLHFVAMHGDARGQLSEFLAAAAEVGCLSRRGPRAAGATPASRAARAARSRPHRQLLRQASSRVSRCCCRAASSAVSAASRSSVFRRSAISCAFSATRADSRRSRSATVSARSTLRA